MIREEYDNESHQVAEGCFLKHPCCSATRVVLDFHVSSPPTHGKEGKERIEIRRLNCCVFTCEVNFRPEFYLDEIEASIARVWKGFLEGLERKKRMRINLLSSRRV